MGLLTGLASSSISPVSVKTTRAIVLALVAVGATGIVTGITLPQGCSEAWLAGLACSWIGDTVDAIGIGAGAAQIANQQKH
jgi:hypothetical protein